MTTPANPYRKCLTLIVSILDFRWFLQGSSFAQIFFGNILNVLNRTFIHQHLLSRVCCYRKLQLVLLVSSKTSLTLQAVTVWKKDKEVTEESQLWPWWIEKSLPKCFWRVQVFWLDYTELSEMRKEKAQWNCSLHPDSSLTSFQLKGAAALQDTIGG